MLNLHVWLHVVHEMRALVVQKWRPMLHQWHGLSVADWRGIAGLWYDWVGGVWRRSGLLWWALAGCTLVMHGHTHVALVVGWMRRVVRGGRGVA